MSGLTKQSIEGFVTKEPNYGGVMVEITMS